MPGPWRSYRCYANTPLLAILSMVLTSVMVFGCGGGGGYSAPPPPVQNPVPTISSLAPSSTTAGAAAQTLTINGTNFLSTSTVTYNGVAHAATLVSATQSTISLSASDQATAGTYPVVVTNPAPGGGSSNSANFMVANPVPTVTALAPSGSVAGAPGQIVAINGTNFLATSTVTYNGAPHSATFVSSTQLSISLSLGDQATVGSYSVVVTNPSPGGGSSNSVNFTVGVASLGVNVVGLPPGVTGNVRVSGPAAFAEKISSTTTLYVAASGTYTISASVAQSGPPVSPTYYWPSLSATTINVVSGTSPSATVSYQTLTGAWQTLGPDSFNQGAGLPAGAGEMGAVAIYNNNPSIMYAAGGGWGVYGPFIETGVYKTIDGGTTWTQINNGLTDPAVEAVHVDQNNSDVVLAGTYSAGIFRSTDGGDTWTRVAAMGPTGSFIDFQGAIYAGTSQGVAASTDGGATWAIIEPTTAPVGSLATNGSAVYAGLGLTPGCYGAVNAPCVQEPGEGEVLTRLTPTGAWTTSNPPMAGAPPPYYIAHHIAINPGNNLNAFVVDTPGSPPDVYETTDGGSLWTQITIPACGGIDVRSIAISAITGTIFAGCDFAAAQSTDGGNTWSQINGELWDTRVLVPDAGGISGNLIIGTDQGLYQRPPGATAWNSLNSNITSSLLTGLAVQGSTLLGTAQDAVPLISFDGGKTWSTSSAQGEFGMALVNPGQPSDFYVLTGAGFQASFDGGHTFSAPLANSPVAATNQLVAVDPNNPSTVYLATTAGVSVSRDSGNTWTPTSWPVTSASTIAIDPENNQNIYVAPVNGTAAGPSMLIYSKDGGNTWLTWGGAGCGLSTIAIDPSNSQNVAAGNWCGDIYVSSNGGSSFTQSHIPDGEQYCQMPAIRRVLYDPLGSGVLAAAATSGLYLSSDQGAHWTNIRGNAVPMAFNDFQWSGNDVYAATCGEGILQLQH